MWLKTSFVDLPYLIVSIWYMCAAGVNLTKGRVALSASVAQVALVLVKMVAKLYSPGRQLVRMASIPSFTAGASDEFPNKLGPYIMSKTPVRPADFEFSGGQATGACRQWTLKEGILATDRLAPALPSLSGRLSPAHPVTLKPTARTEACIPLEAAEFCWCYAAEKRGDLEGGSGETWSLITKGGFMYFDKAHELLQANACGMAPPGTEGGLEFSVPRKWRSEWTRDLARKKRWQEVTMNSMVGAGAQYYSWIIPNEKFFDDQGRELPLQPDAPSGAFAYLFHDIEDEHDDMDVYFCVDGTLRRRWNRNSTLVFHDAQECV